MTVTSWSEIENQAFLERIVVTVVEADNVDGERLDWRLTVEDTSGKHFEVDIWQKHDPLFEWEAGAQYEIRGAYGQTWADGRQRKLHSSRKWSADRVGEGYDCRLMVMGDTHIGRAEHPSKPYLPIDCAGKFRQAIEAAVTNNTEYILHTGDVFHDAVTETDCEVADEAFERMEDVGIEFLYILGNHECDHGNQLLRRWEQRGVARHLDMDGVNVSDSIWVYGYDHYNESTFSLDAMGVPFVPADSVSILVLHQTLAPFRDGVTVDLDEINDQSVNGFDYVISGHLHDPEQPNWDGGEFLYAGSTENISTNPSPSDPSVWLLTVDGKSIETQRRKL